MFPTFLLHNRLQLFRDFLFVLRGLWFFLLINCLAAVVLLFLPQGTDLLQVLLENNIFSSQPFPVFFLCVAVFCWCISTEFCTRFLLYMTDNSGHSLSPERVLLRKNIQVFIAKIFLYFPIFLVTVSLWKAYLQNNLETHFSLWALLSVLLLLSLEWLGLYFLYHPTKKNILTKRFPWLSLSDQEKYWTGKLYGIFNNYRIDLPKGLVVANTKEDLPRECLLPNAILIPKSFQLIQQCQSTDLMQVWVYRIPVTFYRNLLLQLFLLATCAFCLIILFALMNTSEYQFFGASALICFSFASWQLLYVVLHFLDKAQPLKKITLTYRLFFLVWLIGCSYLNSDHPVRVYANNSIQQQIAIPSHFEKWVDTLFKSSNIAKAHATVPIFLIAAEGGGLRTGAFTALLLSKLQDSFPDFKKHIYAYSTVSGGGLGTHFFNSINNYTPSLPAKGNAELSRIFFKTDFLSAVIGKLVFGEVIQWISPIYIPLFDRAITLEKVWEEAWQSATGSGEMKNVFSKSIVGNNQRIQPAYFINTVEAETGMPCIWTNMKLGNSFPFSEDRNLQKRFPFQLRYSTAINLSTRFPLISPSAMFAFKVSGKQIRRHYVDGGYFDNSGQETMLQVLKSIPFEKHQRVKPYIICFNFSESDTTIGRGIRFANDVSEIVRAIYQTHNARTAMASAVLKDYCNNRFSSDQYIALSLDINTNQLPMNWVLSNTALQRVDNYTNDLMHQKKNSSEMCKIMKAISSP